MGRYPVSSLDHPFSFAESKARVETTIVVGLILVLRFVVSEITGDIIVFRAEQEAVSIGRCQTATVAAAVRSRVVPWTSSVERRFASPIHCRPESEQSPAEAAAEDEHKDRDEHLLSRRRLPRVVVPALRAQRGRLLRQTTETRRSRRQRLHSAVCLLRHHRPVALQFRLESGAVRMADERLSTGRYGAGRWTSGGETVSSKCD